MQFLRREVYSLKEAHKLYGLSPLVLKQGNKTGYIQAIRAPKIKKSESDRKYFVEIEDMESYRRSYALWRSLFISSYDMASKLGIKKQTLFNRYKRGEMKLIALPPLIVFKNCMSGNASYVHIDDMELLLRYINLVTADAMPRDVDFGWNGKIWEPDYPLVTPSEFAPRMKEECLAKRRKYFY